MNQTYLELVKLRSYLKPTDEFMCTTAIIYGLKFAYEAVQGSVSAVGQLCLQTHWEIITDKPCGWCDHENPEYQTFRKQWLDALIEEYAQ